MKTDNLRVFNKVLLLCTLLGMLVLHSVAEAQILRQMRFEEVPAEESKPYVVRNPEQAILAVYSTIANLQFQSNRSIIKVDDDGGGRYLLHLPPGTHLITVQAEGFASIQERFVLPAKQAKEIRVVPAGTAAEAVEYGTVEYTIAPGNVIVIRDGTQAGQFNVGSSGRLRLNLAPGSHTVRLVRGGNQIYDGQYTINTGETVHDTVTFTTSDVSPQAVSTNTGILLVKSEPGGALVILDGTEAGQTPYEIREIGAGEHTVRLEKRFYKPLQKTFVIEPDAVMTLDEKLPPDFGTMTIRSTPTGAEVHIGGTFVGRTPYSMDMVETGSHSISLRLTRYHDAVYQMQIKAGDRIDTTFTMSPAFGSLSVTSEPKAATVYLDNDLVGRTPIDVDTVMSGDHLIRVEKDLYRTQERQITVRDGVHSPLDIRLDQNFGTLIVTSEPSGMNVNLAERGTATGRTPWARNIEPGVYTVNITEALYEPESQMVTVRMGDTTRLDLSLRRKAGTLRLFSSPLEAEITIDDKPYGTTPIVLKDFPTGTYEITASKMGYKARTETVTVPYNSPVEQEFVLDRGSTPNTGIFDFSNLPAGIHVYHNGSLLGETPLSYIEAPKGNHKLKFSKKHYESGGTIKYSLADQQTIRPTIQLTPKSRGKAALRSLFFPGWGQHYSDQKVKGTVYLLAELASLGWLGYNFMDYQTKKSDYEDAIAEYESVTSSSGEAAAWDKLDAAYQPASDASDALTTAFLIPIGVHAVAVLDALIFGGAPGHVKNEYQRQFGIEYRSPDHKSVGVSLYARF